MKRRTIKEISEEVDKYSIQFTNKIWIGFRECPECKSQIRHQATERYYLLRNLRKVEFLCCKSYNKKGEKNHFKGKVQLQILYFNIYFFCQEDCKLPCYEC